MVLENIFGETPGQAHLLEVARVGPTLLCALSFNLLPLRGLDAICWFGRLANGPTSANTHWSGVLSMLLSRTEPRVLAIVAPQA
jgi:hypothetical protein